MRNRKVEITFIIIVLSLIAICLLMGKKAHASTLAPTLEERVEALEQIISDPEGTVKSTASDVKKLKSITLSGYVQGRYQRNQNAETGTSVVDDFYLPRCLLLNS